jgi:hypothetical protein
MTAWRAATQAARHFYRLYRCAAAADEASLAIDYRLRNRAAAFSAGRSKRR